MLLNYTFGTDQKIHNVITNLRALIGEDDTWTIQEDLQKQGLTGEKLYNALMDVYSLRKESIGVKKMKTILYNQKELDDFLKSHSDKLIGLIKGFGTIEAYIFDNWNDIKNDVYRQGIYKNGKIANPPKSWKKRENKIKNYVGCE